MAKSLLISRLPDASEFPEDIGEFFQGTGQRNEGWPTKSGVTSKKVRNYI